MNDFSPATLAQAPVAPVAAILAAADTLLPLLERGQRVDAAMLRTAMETVFGASDAGLRPLQRDHLVETALLRSSWT